MNQYLIYNFKCDECGETEYSIVPINDEEFLLLCDNCGTVHDINNFEHEIIKNEED